MSDLFPEGTEQIIYMQAGCAVLFIFGIGFVIGLLIGVLVL